MKGAVPYGLEDLFRAEQTVYDVDPKYLSMIRDLSKEILMVSADIAEHAELPIMVVENGLGAYDAKAEDGKLHNDYRIDYLRQQKTSGLLFRLLSRIAASWNEE